MQQKLDLALRGLYTSPNNLSGVPQGSLEVADNVVLNSKSLIESRRGQTQYGTPLALNLNEQVNKLFNYNTNLICSYGDKLAYDNSGVWADYLGTYTAPSNEFKMRSLEAARNFYFTTSKGIYKLDKINKTPTLAGVVPALGGVGSLSGASGFLLDDSAVAYQLVWAVRDDNQNLILGAPSQRLVIDNTSGTSSDVSLTFSIPDGITPDHFYQIYRTMGTSSAVIEPSTELQLALQASPTPTEILNKSFTVIDNVPESLLRTTLYTSPSQQGAENSNYPPPLAIDMDVFKNCAFYANTSNKQQLSLSMIAAVSPAIGYVTETMNTTNSSDVISIVDTTPIHIGMLVVGAGIPADTVVVSVDSATDLTISNNATATGSGVSVEFRDRFTIAGIDFWAGSVKDIPSNTFLVDSSGTPSQNLNETALNLIEVINTSPTNSLVYAYYMSGLLDLPGQMRFEARSLDFPSFSITSTAGGSFAPFLPSSGDGVSSTAEVRQNRVYISKPNEVESVPIYRYFDIGSANFPIQRVVALRDGIFFFKQDGIYRISGETFESFSVTLIDNTVVLQVPESAVAFNNQVFCFTTQGIGAVTDSGFQIMSVPIENQLLELSSDQYVNFDTASFGVAYESARMYMFFTVTREDDEFATQAFIYNSLTDSWTRWVMNRTCGIVNPTVNKLFMAQPDTGQILIERKNYTNSDYADEEYPIVIDLIISPTEIELSSGSALVKEGMTIQQGIRDALVVEVTGDVVKVDNATFLQTGPATVFTPIENTIRWSPIDVENPGILKQFSEITLFFKNAAFKEIEASFSTNISTGDVTVPISSRAQTPWGGFPWGDVAWGGTLGGQNALRTYVPRDKQRANWINITITTNEAFTGFSLQGISLQFNAMSSRFK